MIKLVREFNNVGQGAFYTEKFYDDSNKLIYTMVYDCGSYGNRALIEKSIKENLKDKNIDLLCISHFHEDHINGLEYLLKEYRIKR